MGRNALLACWICGSWLACAQESAPEKLIEAGHWKRARAIVEARIREAPNDPLANFLLSQVRNAFGDRESPLPLAEKAVTLDGLRAKYHRQVAEVTGVMAQHSGMVQQLLLARRFRKEIDLALALDPHDVQALRDLMEYYLLAPGIAGGDQHKAGAVAERIAAADPAEGLLARARLAAFHKQAGENEALLRRAADAQPPRYRARMAAAQFFVSREPADLKSAEQYAGEALQLDRTRVDAYAILAVVHASRSEWNQLEAILAESAKEVPDDPVPLYRAAEKLLALGQDLPRAERYLRTYLAQPAEGNEPTAAEARWKLGLVLQKEGRTSEAAEQWTESVRLDPESPAAAELKRAHNSRRPDASPARSQGQ
jgi:tetratricopeptide (TPR) repeat protein